MRRTVTEVGVEPPWDPTEMRKFLEESPLYVWVGLRYPRQRDLVQPPRVEVHCEKCGCSRPYSSREAHPVQQLLDSLGPVPHRGPAPVEDGSLVILPYLCSGCGAPLEFLVEFSEKPEGRVRKVGQRPPQSIEVPKELAAALGPEDSDLFRRAKVCLGRGYGIGACAYLRRVLEHQVNAILDLVLEAEGTTEEERARIRQTVKGKAGDEKMKLAYQHAPPSLAVEGSNPLKLLYSFLSVAIHALPEDEAVKMATATETALVFTVRELGQAKAEREAFAKAMRELGKQRA